MVVAALVLWSALHATVHCLNNGVGLTPPMGFNPWNYFGRMANGHPKLNTSHQVYVDERTFHEIADILAKPPLSTAGYKYVNFDCGWTNGHRSAQGLEVNQTAFPSGLKALADYIHGKGLKFGMYVGGYHAQCCNKKIPGSNDTSAGHEVADASWMAELGTDYVKLDCCGYPNDVQYSTLFRNALNATGRPMFFQANDLKDHPQKSLPPVMNSARRTGDISNLWDKVLTNIRNNDVYAKTAGPGFWNDPDLLEIGNDGMTDPGKMRAQFSLWCLAKAPLLISTDLRRVGKEVMDVLGNVDAVAVNQDPMGIQGTRKRVKGGSEVWVGPLSGSGWAVVLLNTGPETEDITLRWGDLPVANGTKFDVRELWTGHTLTGRTASVMYSVPSNDVAMLRLTPSV